jgi:hypothetical protein
VTDPKERRGHTGDSLSRGDQVFGTLNGEVGIVVDVEGCHIRVRIDSSGEVWSSNPRLWVRR